MNGSRVNRRYREPAFGGEPFSWRFWFGLAMLLLPAAVLALLMFDALTATDTEWIVMTASERVEAIESNPPGTVIPDTRPVEFERIDWGVFALGMLFLTLLVVLVVRVIVREQRVARQRRERPELFSGDAGNLIVPAGHVVAAYAEQLDREQIGHDLAD